MKKFFDLIKKYFLGASEHRITAYSAASAFSLFVCAIPFLIIIISLIPYTPISESWLLNITNSFLPIDTIDFVKSIVYELYDKSLGAISISVIILFWSSSRTLVFIRDGLNDIYGYYEKKNFILVRTIATAFMIIVVLLVIGLSFVQVLSTALTNLLLTINIRIPGWLSLITNYRVLIVLLGTFISYEALYVFVPARKNKIVGELPGAILASVLSYFLLLGFNIVLNKFVSFTMYGSLAAIIVILFYFEFCCWIFFYGAYLNKFIRDENITLKKETKTFLIVMMLSCLIYLFISLVLKESLDLFNIGEVKPYTVLCPFFGICFGLPSAIGISIANFLYRYLYTYPINIMMEELVPYFLYGYIPYLMWKGLNNGEDHIHRLDSCSRVLKFVLTIVCYSLLSAILETIIINNSNAIEYAVFTFLNNFTFGIVLGCPLMVISNLHMAKKFGKERTISLNEKIIISTAIVEMIMIVVISIVVYQIPNDFGTIDVWDSIFIYSIIGLYICMSLSLLTMKLLERKKEITIK